VTIYIYIIYIYIYIIIIAHTVQARSPKIYCYLSSGGCNDEDG